MIDIICIALLWMVNSRNALANGQKPGKYRWITLALWYGMELVGCLIGVFFVQLFIPGKDPTMGGYIFGGAGAAIGGYISWRMAKYAPQGDFASEKMQSTSVLMSRDVNAMEIERNEESDMSMNENKKSGPERLEKRAKVRIINKDVQEERENAFFINGFPVCKLKNGQEYIFTTPFVKNTVMIGSAQEDVKDPARTVRFISVPDGYAEIHAEDGMLNLSKFRNLRAMPKKEQL